MVPFNALSCIKVTQAKVMMMFRVYTITFLCIGAHLHHLCLTKWRVRTQYYTINGKHDIQVSQLPSLGFPRYQFPDHLKKDNEQLGG